MGWRNAPLDLHRSVWSRYGSSGIWIKSLLISLHRLPNYRSSHLHRPALSSLRPLQPSRVWMRSSYTHGFSSPSVLAIQCLTITGILRVRTLLGRRYLPTKVSILLLHMRIIGRLLYIRHLATATGVFTVFWAIMVFVVVCFQCRPIEFMWNKSVSGTCINSWLFFVIGSTINSFTDVAILLRPIRATWNSQMLKAQKLSITGTFSLGSL